MQLDEFVRLQYLLHVPVLKLCAKALRLLLHLIDQVLPVGRLHEAREVLYQRGGDELAAGRIAVQHDGRQLSARGIDGGG